jgi:hypothetical protein
MVERSMSIIDRSFLEARAVEPAAVSSDECNGRASTSHRRADHEVPPIATFGAFGGVRSVNDHSWSARAT